jgi:ABC-2 type transport system ATP-binding protein
MLRRACMSPMISIAKGGVCSRHSIEPPHLRESRRCKERRRSFTVLLDLQKLSRNFGHVQALREITLRLETGTVGLVGNNGAGKSTLLKILLGLLPASSGSGTILGCDLRHTGLKLRGRIGYMPEAAATVPLLKGVEYVALSGDLYGMPFRDARRRAHEVLNYVGLGELRYRRLDEYSLGNLQRLKLAAALVHDPELLLLDEPTNGLDPAGRQSMLGLLEDLIAETGKSLILCTHVLKDVEKLCQQVVVLHQGTVAKSGPIEQMTKAAENRFEVQWRDADSSFLNRLREAGGNVFQENESTTATALVSLPETWGTRQLFGLAADCGTVITRLREDDEDLERLFLRLTGNQPSIAEN